MSLAIPAACLWVLATCALALLPIRAQFAPGALLLLSAPALLWWLGRDHGPVLVAALLLALLALFRKPLAYLLQRRTRPEPERRI